MYVFPLFFLGIMNKFIIMNVHDVTRKKPQKISLIFFHFLISMYEKNWC